ncbi:RNA-binding cell elongation regulator Jag/EloR [Enterococcus sp. LJL90]
MAVFEGKTVEEAIESGLQQLGISKKDAKITIIEESKKGFLGLGKKMAQVDISPKEPVVEEVMTEIVTETADPEAVAVMETEIFEAEPQAAEEVSAPQMKVFENLNDDEALTELALYMTNISQELGVPALVKISRKADVVTLNLESDKQGILIGKHGKTLNALQYLAQVFIHRAAANKLSVVINVGDYREKRQAILEKLAKRTADKVKQTGQAVFLEPMPAYERKQIHSVLSQDEYIKTHSEGEEPYRYLVVEPAKKYF